MCDPWDRPPIPPSGDPHEDITYRAVGRFLSRWENIESELSHLYAIFIGKYFKPEAYDEYYDKSKTFGMRMNTLKKAASKFFVQRPSQIDEGDFSNLVDRVSGFGDRRHEIAHGIVRPYQYYAPLTEWSDPYNDDPNPTCLAPPHYQRSWFGELQLPKYVYVSTQIDKMTNKLSDLLTDILEFKHRLVSPELSQN